jgi:hypothetical protein
MFDWPNEDPPDGSFVSRVLFDNGVARVESHPKYGAIMRGTVKVVVISGIPAFVPAEPGEDDLVIVPDDTSGLV